MGSRAERLADHGATTCPIDCVKAGAVNETSEHPVLGLPSNTTLYKGLRWPKNLALVVCTPESRQCKDC